MASSLKGLSRAIGHSIESSIYHSLRLGKRFSAHQAGIESGAVRLDVIERRLAALEKPPVIDARPFIQRMHRDDFGTLFNGMGYRGIGAEIGVQRGIYSEILLNTWCGEKLICIDPWRHFASASGYVDTANQEQAEQDRRYEATKERLARFGERVEILRHTSAEAAPLVADSTLDFAYLDGQHHYEAVKEDIALWWPKLVPGGCLCGDDYADYDLPDTVFGVKTAVDEFAREAGHEVYLTGSRPNWVIFKPR